MTTCEQLLDHSASQSHLVQLYETDERVLHANVTRYISEGLKRGSTVICIATESHRRSFGWGIQCAGVDLEAAERDSQLVFFDAEETLGRLMVGGHPDGARFEGIVAKAVLEGLERAGGRGLRAYGEMVGVLWKSKQHPAAIRLEQLWDKLLKKADFSLYCTYPIDIFSKDFEPEIVDALLCAHTHLMPTGTNGDLAHAITRAMDEVLGVKQTVNLWPRIFEGLRSSWAAIPTGERMILWLRAKLPEKADDILGRARAYYLAST